MHVMSWRISTLEAHRCPHIRNRGYHALSDLVYAMSVAGLHIGPSPHHVSKVHAVSVPGSACKGAQMYTYSVACMYVSTVPCLGRRRAGALQHAE
eukprot:479040-Rhodomonas_salina.6